MKKRILFNGLTLFFLSVMFIGASFGQDNVVYNFDTDVEGWTKLNANSFVSTDGTLIISKTTAGGWVGTFSPEGTWDANVYTQMEVVIKNNALVGADPSDNTVYEFEETCDSLQIMNFDYDALTNPGASEKLNVYVGPGASTNTFDIPVNADNNGVIYRFGLRGKSNDVYAKTAGGDSIETITPGKLLGTLEIESITLKSIYHGQASHPINVTIEGGGSVFPADGSSFLEGSTQDITATPLWGWEFDSWGGDLSGSTNPTTITMDAEKNITAIFTQKDNFDYAWNFDTDDDNEGWIPNTNGVSSITGGINTITYDKIAPSMTLNNVFILADDYAVAEVKVKNNTNITGAAEFNSNAMKFNFIIEADNITYTQTENSYRAIRNDSELKSGNVTANDSEFKTYQVKVNPLAAVRDVDGNILTKSSGSGDSTVVAINPKIVSIQYFTPKDPAGSKDPADADGKTYLDPKPTYEVDHIKMIRKLDQTITFNEITYAAVGDTIQTEAVSESELPVKLESSDTNIVKVH